VHAQAGAPVFQATPTSIDFGSVAVDGTAELIDLNINNTGTATLHLLSTPAIQGSQAGDFEACFPATGHCGGPFVWPAMIAPGSGIDVKMAFTPGGPGSRSAQLVFSTDAAGSPQMVPLQGNGAAALGITANGNSTDTVTAGQMAVYGLTVTTTASLSGTLTTSCSGVPAGASCNFNAATVGITGPGRQDIGLNVATTPRASAVLHRAPKFWAPAAVFLGIILVVPHKRSAFWPCYA
jgi:hypothetical protein